MKSLKEMRNKKKKGRGTSVKDAITVNYIVYLLIKYSKLVNIVNQWKK